MQVTWEVPYNVPGSVDGQGNEVVDRYPCPNDLKEPALLYWFDKNRQNVVQFYNQTSIETIRQRRAQPIPMQGGRTTFDQIYNDPTFLFAIWNNTIEIYPKPIVTDPTQVLRLDYYAWMQPPGENSFDWFTTNARRYLQYKACAYSVPVTVSDPRMTMWTSLYTEAYKKTKNADIAAKWSGVLIMRG
jgi:hypothetical protein